MTTEAVSSLSDYIRHLAKNSNIDVTTIEKVINTQIAVLFGDLAVKGNATCFLGDLFYTEDQVSLDPSRFIVGLTRGTIDPTLILKEILENV